jgi:hypothetical protein
MTRFVMATTAAVILGCAPAFAQVSPGLPPLGMTSPLGVGPALPVPPARVPLGATELAAPGVSPLTSVTSPLGPATPTMSGCRGIGGSIAESSFGLGTSVTASGAGVSSPGVGTSSVMGSSSSVVGGSSTGMGSSTAGTSYGTGTSTAGTSMSPTVFDGGGVAGNASGTCPSTDNASLAGPAASASSPTGTGYGSSVARVGIPMGSTELGAGGLSPAPTISSTMPRWARFRARPPDCLRPPERLQRPE